MVIHACSTLKVPVSNFGLLEINAVDPKSQMIKKSLNLQCDQILRVHILKKNAIILVELKTAISIYFSIAVQKR